MSPDEIETKIGEIQQCVNSRILFEATVAERDLHVQVLRAISERRCEDPAASAAAAMQSLKITFPRAV